MSLRASYQDQHSADSAYNRYMKNFDMMVSEVEDGLAVDRNTGDKMWNVKVTANDKKRVLGPKNVPGNIPPKLRILFARCAALTSVSCDSECDANDVSA